MRYCDCRRRSGGDDAGGVSGRGRLDVICIDQFDPKAQIKADERTTAVSFGSRKILEQAGVWESCAPEACPIRDIRILDGQGSRVLLNFLSEEADGKDFGWIVENAVLRRACLDKLAALKTVTFMAPAKAKSFDLGADGASVTLDDGSVINAALIVGADGRKSPLRTALDIETRGRDYGQRALVSIIGHENPHDGVAIEHFYPAGPFAVLPMTDAPDGTHRSSIVLTEHGPEDKSMMHFSKEAFMAALEARLPESYGVISMRMGPQAFPLNLVHSESYTAPRAALIGDAAHGIHPIAGQGLNLGYRDVKALADLLISAKAAGKDYGDPALLEQYERARRMDVTAMVAFTDGLVSLFSNDIAPVRLVRKIGLKAVSKLPLAKRFFMRRAMGE
ncbi:MAG: UbiH/UbiF/VisC/COQ6 family ubiquinone biosynthesis hydroxylase [Alphaproteobacteria bacterium]|nr:UbiH/UbiF/VisC/COQ6 family ubiquinone biosynthesis hydroxylase [Alphaproteobacteria bacterium]